MMIPHGPEKNRWQCVINPAQNFVISAPAEMMNRKRLEMKKVYLSSGLPSNSTQEIS